MEVVLPGQLYSGDRKNAITGSWWQLRGLCSSGAGKEHLTFGGALCSKRVFKQCPSRAVPRTRGARPSPEHGNTQHESYCRGWCRFDLPPSTEEGCSHAGTNNPPCSCAGCTSSSPEGKEHFCMVTICSTRCALSGEGNPTSLGECHPKSSLGSQLGSPTCTRGMGRRSSNSKRHGGTGKGWNWDIHGGHQHPEEPCPLLRANKELELPSQSSGAPLTTPTTQRNSHGPQMQRKLVF